MLKAAECLCVCVCACVCVCVREREREREGERGWGGTVLKTQKTSMRKKEGPR